MDKTLSVEMVRFFERYLAFYKEFLELETKKHADIADNLVSKLPEHMKREEVYSMKSRSIEKEREKLMEKGRFSSLTFKQLLPLFDEPEQSEMRKIYVELSKVLLDLKSVNQLSNTMISLRLHRVKLELQKLETRPELRKLYNEKAHCNHETRAILSQKV